MNAQTLSRELALRIGLAARVLPETDPRRLLNVLAASIGLPITEEKLARITVKDLRTAADGEMAGISVEDLKRAVRCLWGEESAGEPDNLPRPTPLGEGEMPGSIRVACASNGGERLDGHFGSCLRFLIYQVSPDELRLINIRSARDPEGKDDRNAYRAQIISDCHLVYVISIGGPAAAKMVKAGVHPIKVHLGSETHGVLSELQGILKGNPPPWLAKVMGARPEERIRFQQESKAGC